MGTENGRKKPPIGFFLVLTFGGIVVGRFVGGMEGTLLAGRNLSTAIKNGFEYSAGWIIPFVLVVIAYGIYHYVKKKSKGN